MGFILQGVLLPISAKQKAQGGMGEILLFLLEYQKRCPPNNHAENTVLCLSQSLVTLLVILEQLS